MSPDALLALPVLILYGAVGLCPGVVLLKQKYVLFVVGLLLVVLGIPEAATTTGPGVTGIGLVVWIVAAVRLAPPASRWARQLYGPEKLARARERPAGVATLMVAQQQEAEPADPEPGPPPAPPPTALTVATVLAAVGLLVLGLGSGFSLVGFMLAAAVAPVLYLVRTGWRRGRTVAVVVGGLFVVAVAVAFVLAGVVPVVPVIGLLVSVAGLVLLHRDPADAYLRVADRPTA